MALRKPVKEPAIIEYYYDTHPTHEDLMGESTFQADLIHYLVDILRWLYRAENWFIATNLNIYQSHDYLEYPLAPDVALFKGIEKPKNGLRSWKLLLPDRPAPNVVFEICSDGTITDDLEEKPEKYRKLGVREYFAYDPHEPVLRKKYSARLFGWRYNPGGETERLRVDERGWLWSEELESWLAGEGLYLRLYDRDGNLRLTEAEAEQQRAEAERVAKEAAWAKLRELGIDPEKLY
jgi:Uma2 family endonuclease